MCKMIAAALLAATSLAAISFPATALARNEPQLTEAGSLIAKGSKILATNEGSAIFKDTPGNTLIGCSTARLTGEVTKNEANMVEGRLTSALFGGTGARLAAEPESECTGSLMTVSFTALNLPWTIKSTPLMATDQFQISAPSGKVKFLWILTTSFGNIDCEFEANNTALTGSFTTNTSIHTLTITSTPAESGFTRTKGGFPCPSSLYLEVAFNLETDAFPSTSLTVS